MKLLFILALIASLNIKIYSQGNFEESQRFIFFPQERIFPLINLDPLSCKIYGGIHVLFEEGKKKEGVFIPVNLGFSKPFFGYNLNEAKLELGLEAASFTQFEIVHVESNTYLGGLFNNDYKASAYFSIYYKEVSYRIRLFHISSHLGDDYMIRNEEFSRNDKSVNYEQIDLTILKSITNTEYYAGLGYIITPNAFRERFSFQAGIQYKKSNEKIFQLIGGLGLKLLEQNSFYPNIRTAIGTEINNKTNPCFRIQLEMYHGHLPYSVQEYRKITWVGISSSLEL